MPERKIEVSIDRITVTGTNEMSVAEFSNILGPEWFLDNGSYILSRKYEDGSEENLARIFLNPFSNNSYRIDFNPNRLEMNERISIGQAVKLLDSAHFTRLDIAFDVFNEPLIMEHRVYRTGVSSTEISTEDLSEIMKIRGRSSKLETMYWGKRSSEQQIRLYDKKVEQRAHRKIVPTDIEEWGRLELQLRGAKTGEWFENAYQMLDEFKLPKIHLVKDKRDADALFCIQMGFKSYADYNPNIRARLRKLVKQSQGFDTTLADEMKKVLNENLENLNEDLSEYLANFGVQK